MQKQFIVRISPVTRGPVLFDALSRNNGRLTAIVNNQEVEVGLDYYSASEPMDENQARQIVQAYAKQANIPEHEFLVRQRLPKTEAKTRKTNDANLVLVPNDRRRKDDKPAEDTLATVAQALHDSETQAPKADAKAEEVKPQTKNTGKSTADNPEGATVKRQAGEKRAKRPYHRKSSKKSDAAMKRYLAEIGQIAAEQPAMMGPAAPTTDQKTIDEATLELALKLAAILKKNPGLI